MGRSATAHRTRTARSSARCRRSAGVINTTQPAAQPINRFHSIDKRNVPAFYSDLLEYAAMGAAVQGPRAFENPRSATLVHESSHAVAYAALGVPVKRTKIWKVKRGIGAGQWLGATLADGTSWHVDDTTTPKNDFIIAACYIAGVLGEALFDHKNFRAASSADEVVLSRQIANSISFKTGRPFEEVMTGIICAVSDILETNADVVRAIAAELDRREVIRRKRLAVLLAPVKAWRVQV